MEDLFIHLRNESNDSNVNWYTTHPQLRQPAEGKVPCPLRSKVTEIITLNVLCSGVEVGPSPSNVNLQNERPVCMSFTFEGHGDHYLKIVIQWCRGWVRTGSVCFIAKQICNIYLLRRGSEIPHHRVYCPSLLHRGPSYFNTKAVEYYTEPHKYYSDPNYSTTIEAAKYYVAQTYNTAAAPSYYVELYYDEAPNYHYTEKATHYTTTYTAPVYFTEEPKYDSAPSYYQTEAPVYYTKATGYYTTTKW
ncbi:hypothetical protein DAPPUDRAFT_319206 [Daphnia pulex]|uniref:Uncharacterized protein n=1 Tax=Daphnia pulex TaxID=6669 RepID=E9GL05_DAPPU|nr:hypothetical protein DAPPUDRAFT_319206 [Daphnia pulex]|eukprot:EFX79878.1 hypothetical protein DAPPUDRAFT_319206 [Daphnia pulex]